VKILKERRERDLFLNSAVSSTKRTPCRERERERERARERGSEKFKSETSKNHLFKKKREVFSTRTGLFCLRARTRELISHKHATQTLVYARNH